MLLQEALDLLQKGEVLCRDAWALEEGYIAFMRGMQHVWKIVLHPSPNAGNYIFSMADLLASDWKLFETPAKEVKAEQQEAA